MAAPDNNYLHSAANSKKHRFAQYLLAFMPRKNYFITPLIIDLNIAVYLFLLFVGADPISPSSDIILKWGANFAPLTFDGQWWRLFTSCFLHFGILHIAFNMYALFFIGFLLEPLLGKSRFLVAYLSCGLLSSLASLWWNTLVVSAGASGAIFGMYGLFLALLTTNLIPKQYRQSQLQTMVIFVVFNLAFGATGGIDNAAHIGGLLAGIVIGYLYYPSIIRPRLPQFKFATVGLLTICVGAGSAFAFQRIPHDAATYYNIMNKFDELDGRASKYSEQLSSLPRDEMVQGLKNLETNYWQPGIVLLQQTETLNLPNEEDHQKARTFIHYCRLRIQSDQLYVKAITENSHRYDAQIKTVNEEIKTIINDF